MSHRAKLAWARKHLDTLDAEIEAFVQGDTYTAATHYDAKQRCHVARIKVNRGLPDHWGLMVGDIVPQPPKRARQFGLCARLEAQRPTEQEARSIQFLIADKRGEFEHPNRARLLSRVSPAAKAAIERLQPYHRRHARFKHTLSVLRDLSNVDKHRHLNITRATAERSSIALSSSYIVPGTEFAGFTGPFENNTVIARWKFVGPVPTNVEVRGQFEVAIQFGEGPAREAGVEAYLDFAHRHIGDEVFPALEPFL